MHLSGKATAPQKTGPPFRGPIFFEKLARGRVPNDVGGDDSQTLRGGENFFALSEVLEVDFLGLEPRPDRLRGLGLGRGLGPLGDPLWRGPPLGLKIPVGLDLGRG